jgi:hypothetical protein
MLHVRLAEKMASAKNDGPRVRRKAASTAHVTWRTENIRRRYFATREFEMSQHEHNRRT